MTNNRTGIQLNLSAVQGVLVLKNPDIHCNIDGTVYTLKFGKHTLELPSGNHVLTVKTGPDPIFGTIIEDQTISFTIQENALTCIDYQVDMFFKSSIKLEGIKEQKLEQPKEVKTIGIGRTLGKIVGSINRAFKK